MGCRVRQRRPVEGLLVRCEPVDGVDQVAGGQGGLLGGVLALSVGVRVGFVGVVVGADGTQDGGSQPVLHRGAGVAVCGDGISRQGMVPSVRTGRAVALTRRCAPRRNVSGPPPTDRWAGPTRVWDPDTGVGLGRQSALWHGLAHGSAVAGPLLSVL